MKKFASILFAVLLVAVFAIPAFATDGPSVSRPDPVVVDELPDPNVPGAPDFVLLTPEDDPAGEPEPYVRVEDPNSPDPENPEYEYVPESEVPLANTPEDDDNGNSNEDSVPTVGVAEAAHTHFGDPTCWTILIVSALVGLIAGILVGRGSKKKGDKDDKAA